MAMRPKSRSDNQGYAPKVEEGSTNGTTDFRKKGMTMSTVNNLTTSLRPKARPMVAGSVGSTESTRGFKPLGK
tara:strand:- start:731 stop:949 length:219 start_codon:yes stop_codon:yes gene_type:complete